MGQDTGELEDSPLNRGVMEEFSEEEDDWSWTYGHKKGQLRQDVRKSFPGEEQQAYQIQKQKGIW